MLRRKALPVVALIVVAVLGQVITRAGKPGPHALSAKAAADPNSPGASGLLTMDDLNLEDSPGGKAELFRRFSYAILLVAALGAGAYWFTRKLVPGVTASKGKNITVVETVSLGTGKTLHLVEVSNHQKLLLGCTAQSISLLAHLGDPIPQLSDDIEED